MRRNQLKVLGGLAAFFLIVGLLAACNSGNSGNAGNTGTVGSAGQVNNTSSTDTSHSLKGEFTVWTWDLKHENLLAAFKKKYPDIKIKIVDVANGDMLHKVQTTIASGGALPDMIRIDRTHLPRYIEMDILENLEQDPYNAARTVFFDYDIAPHLNKDGKLIAIPEDMSVAGLAYKKNLTKEYFGTDDPVQLEQMFPTWDAFIKKGKEVLDKSGGKVKMFSSLSDVYVLVSGQRPAPYFKGDNLKEDVLRTVYEKIIKFRDAGIVDKLDAWTPAWNAAFAKDSHIYSPSAVWGPQYMIGPNDKNGGPRWGLMVPPQGGVIWGGSSHGILKNAKNKELAYKFIEFSSMTQEGAEAFKKDGMFTHYKAAYDDKAFASWTWPNFGEQNIGEKFFLNISSTTKEAAASKYDLILGEANAVVLQELNKNKNFGIEDTLKLIKSELRAKDKRIVVE